LPAKLGLGFIQKYKKKIKKAIETKMFKSYNNETRLCFEHFGKREKEEAMVIEEGLRWVRVGEEHGA